LDSFSSDGYSSARTFNPFVARLWSFGYCRADEAKKKHLAAKLTAGLSL
jgi:hypothetical protein